MFTRADLKALATPASFRKGEEYFQQGAVSRLRFEAEAVTATVRGTQRYEVELLDRDARVPEFFCTCPYAYEGICKHAVALGLAVLAQSDDEDQADEPEEPMGEAEALLRQLGLTIIRSAAPATPLPRPEAAKPAPRTALAALREATKPELVKFLEGRLSEDDALARAFLHFIHGPELAADPLEDDLTLPALNQLRQDLSRRLKSLHFDAEALTGEDGRPPTRQYQYYGYGTVELPAAAAAVLNTVLLPLAEQLLSNLRAGRLGEVLRRWHAAWAGIELAARPAADEFWLFGGNTYSFRVGQHWQQLLKRLGFFELVRTAAIEPAEAARCAPLLTRPVLTELQPGRRRATALPGPAAMHVRLLEAAAPNPTVAPALAPALLPHLTHLPPLLRLRLHAGLADWADWEPQARRLAAQHAEVAVELLEFYAADPTRRATLLSVAAGYLSRHPEMVGPFVLRQLRPEDDRALYVQALTHRLDALQDFADFQELTALWTPEERQQFVAQALHGRSKFPPLFQARVMAAERRGAEVLSVALSLDWQPRPPQPADLPTLLTLAARFRPEETLDAVMERTEKLLNSPTKRTPALYPQLVSWLQALLEVPVLTDQVQLFADELYRTYSRLSQLRTALREAELLPDKEPQPPVEPRQPYRRKSKKK